MEVLEDTDDLLVTAFARGHEVTLSNGVHVDRPRLPLVREGGNIANPVEPSDPLFDLLRAPRDAVEDQDPRALEVQADLHDLRCEQNLRFASLKGFEVLVCLVSEPTKIPDRLRHHPLPNPRCNQRDSLGERTNHREPRSDKIEEIIDREVVLRGHEDAFGWVLGPDLRQKVDEGVSAGVTPAAVNERLDSLEQPGALMPLTPEEVDTLLQRRRTKDDAFREQHRIEAPVEFVEVAEVLPHQGLSVGLRTKGLDDERPVPAPRKRAAVVDASRSYYSAVSAVGQRRGGESLRLHRPRRGAISLDKLIDDGANGPFRPIGEVVAKCQLLGDSSVSGCDSPSSQGGSFWLQQRKDLRVPFEVLERGGGGEDQDMFEVGGDPNDPILEVRAEAMEFVDDEHVEAARVDVSEGERWFPFCTTPPELLLPSQADVLTALESIIFIERSRVSPCHDLIAPLRNELVGHHDQRSEVSPLAPKHVEHHKGLDRFPEPNLVGEQVPNPHVRQHPFNVRDLVGVDRRGYPDRRSQRRTDTLEASPDGLHL